jgi:endonuclease YncB( thermonuclease family)
VRQAVREKYGRSAADRREAMEALVGIWKNREDLPDSQQYVRRLRKGKRLRRIAS